VKIIHNTGTAFFSEKFSEVVSPAKAGVQFGGLSGFRLSPE